MIKKFICVQGSPEIPKDSTATQDKPDTLYLVFSPSNDLIGDYKPWQIENNECWQEITTEPAGRWAPEDDDAYYYVDGRSRVIEQTWCSDSFERTLLEVGNVYRTEQEAQDEIKRRESIANAWWPDKSFEFYLWDFLCKEAVLGGAKDSFTSYAYIGACHKTKEACEDWGKEYAHLFDKRPKHD